MSPSFNFDSFAPVKASATLIAEARALHPSNIGFGKWCDVQDFKLKKNDRAAAVAMGQDLERARAVLVATKRRSLRHIHENEFRFPHMGKPANTPEPAVEDKRRSQFRRRQSTPET